MKTHRVYVYGQPQRVVASLVALFVVVAIAYTIVSAADVMWREWRSLMAIRAFESSFEAVESWNGDGDFYVNLNDCVKRAEAVAAAGDWEYVQQFCTQQLQGSRRRCGLALLLLSKRRVSDLTIERLDNISVMPATPAGNAAMIREFVSQSRR